MQGLKVRRDKNEKTGLRDYLVRRCATWGPMNVQQYVSALLLYTSSEIVLQVLL